MTRGRLRTLMNWSGVDAEELARRTDTWPNVVLMYLAGFRAIPDEWSVRAGLAMNDAAGDQSRGLERVGMILDRVGGE